MSSSVEFTFTAVSSSPTVQSSEGSSASSTCMSKSTVVAVMEEGPVVGHTNKAGYADFRGKHRGEWTNIITDNRCKRYGTILRDGVFIFNYAVSTCCLACGSCREWMDSLTIIERTMVDVVKGCRLRGEDVGMEDDVWFDASARVYYSGGPVKECVEARVVEENNRMLKKKVGKAIRKMIEQEAEEDSGWESVDSIE